MARVMKPTGKDGDADGLPVDSENREALCSDMKRTLNGIENDEGMAMMPTKSQKWPR